MLNTKLITAAVLSISLIICGCYILLQPDPPQPVTYESQKETETPAGIEPAASKADIHISKVQATEIAVAVQEKKKPDKVVHTTVPEVVKVVEEQRQKAKADFAIVTDPQQPEKQVKPADLPRSGEVVLNQYNTKAFPQHLVEATVYSAKDYDIAYLSKVKVLGAAGYIGPVIGSKEGTVKIVVRVSVAL